MARFSTECRSGFAASLNQHRRRCARIIRILERAPADAFTIAGHLWRAQTVREQPLLVVWETIGHLDLLVAAGVADEHSDADGGWRYSLARIDVDGPGAKRVVHAG